MAFLYACALLLLADGKQTCPAHFILEWAGQEGRIGISCELLPLVPNDAPLICQLKLQCPTSHNFLVGDVGAMEWLSVEAHRANIAFRLREPGSRDGEGLKTL